MPEAGEPRMWWGQDLGGIELLRATLSEFSFRPHAHEEFFIALTEGGLATPTYRGHTHVIGASDLIVLNPEEAHSGGPPAEGTWTYRALYPRPDLMHEIGAEFPGGRPALPEFGGDGVRDAGSRAACQGAPQGGPADRNGSRGDGLLRPGAPHPTVQAHCGRDSRPVCSPCPGCDSMNSSSVDPGRAALRGAVRARALAA